MPFKLLDIILFVGWMILSVFMIRTIFRARKTLINKFTQEGVSYKVVCEKCNGEYEVNLEEYSKSHFTKSITRTRTKIRGLVQDNSPEYDYQAKKFDCPYCQSREFARVTNINNIREARAPIVLMTYVKAFSPIIAGFFILAILHSILSSLIK